MKTLMIIISFFILQHDFLITNNSIGNYRLGEKYAESYDKDIFSITPDEHKNIVTIIVYATKYRTIFNFGVGSKVRDIKKFYSKKLKINKPKLSKERVTIGSLGLFLTIGNINFIDADENGIIDLVLIQNDSI